MPLVHVQMAAGRSPEMKTALLKALSQVVTERLDVPESNVRVWITEFEPEDYLAGGETLPERRARLQGS